MAKSIRDAERTGNLKPKGVQEAIIPVFEKVFRDFKEEDKQVETVFDKLFNHCWVEMHSATSQEADPQKRQIARTRPKTQAKKVNHP